MNDKFKVSIIIPVYNVENYLDRCLSSIVEQNYKNLEIILIDDGSTDKSGIKCEKWSHRDNRIKVFHQSNQGLSAARNAGLKIASGKYCLFVDSDDWIKKNSIVKLVYFLEKFQLNIISANALKKSKNCKEEKLIRSQLCDNKILTGEEYLVKSIMQHNFMAAVCIRMYDLEFLKKNNLYFKEHIYHEDEEWLPRVLIKTKRIMQIDFDFYQYEIREGSITQKKECRKNIEDIIHTCVELEKFYKSEIKDQTNQKILLDNLVRIYMYTCCMGKYNSKFYKQLIDINFVKRNPKTISTRIKACVYILSKRMYRILVKIKG